MAALLKAVEGGFEGDVEEAELLGGAEVEVLQGVGCEEEDGEGGEDEGVAAAMSASWVMKVKSSAAVLRRERGGCRRRGACPG